MDGWLGFNGILSMQIAAISYNSIIKRTLNKWILQCNNPPDQIKYPDSDHEMAMMSGSHSNKVHS